MHSASSVRLSILDNTQPWKTFITAIKLVEPELLARIEIEANDEELIFQGTTADIEECYKQLSSNLAVPEAIINKLHYSLRRPNADEQQPPPQSPRKDQKIFEVSVANLPAVPQLGDGMRIVANMFGDEFTIQKGVKFIWQEIFSERGQASILVSREPLSNIDQAIWQAYINVITARMQELPLLFLRNCFLGMSKISMTSEVPKHEFMHTVDAELIKKCFGFTQIEQQTYLYFDYALLHNILFPPVVNLPVPKVLEQQEEREKLVVAEELPAQATLTLNKRHFIAYIRQIFKEEFVLQLRERVANRILLPSPFSQAANNIFVMMLDVSSSMNHQNLGEVYKSKIKELLQKLFEECADPNATLYIVPFSNQNHLTIERFGMTDVSVCQDYVKNLKIDGGTKIFGTLMDLLNHQDVRAACPLETNFTIIITTDGDDNTDTEQYQNALKARHHDATMASPKIFILGIGSDYSARKCQAIADTSGGRLIRLESVEHLTELEQHLKEVKLPRTLFELTQTLKDLARQTEQLYVAVFNDPQVIDEHLQEGQEFRVNGQAFVFKGETPQYEVKVVAADQSKSSAGMGLMARVVTQGSAHRLKPFWSSNPPQNYVELQQHESNKRLT